jgi:hypothetical protein
MLPVGRPPDVRSDARTPKHRSANCAEHFGSPSIGCGNRADSRLGRGSAAFIPDVQCGAACVESPAWSSAGQWIGACSSARSGRTLRQGKGGCGGTAHFTRLTGAAGHGRSSDEPPADRSWCTVGPLVGFALGLVSDLSDLIQWERGRTGATGNEWPMPPPRQRRSRLARVCIGSAGWACPSGLCSRAGPVPVVQAEQSRGCEGWRSDEASAPLLPLCARVRALCAAGCRRLLYIARASVAPRFAFVCR